MSRRPPPACGNRLTPLGGVRLRLFLTRGSTLAQWEALGTLKRETQLFRALATRLGGVGLVSYGGPGDEPLARELGLDLVCNRRRLPGRLYTALLARGWGLKDPRVRQVFRSNQVVGAEVALAAARRAGALGVARAGYLPSNIARWRGDAAEEARMTDLEGRVFTTAHRVVVTTQAMARQVVEDYGADPARVRVIPNFVDTERFRPTGRPVPGRVVYVGRLHFEKNLPALIEALASVEASPRPELHLAGDGPQRDQLAALAAGRGVEAVFHGPVANADLPRLIGSAALFALPSLGEHHPKALIEAMSCGRPVLGCDVPGVREVIQPGVTGWLAGTDAADLAPAITQALADPDAAEARGRAAREWVEARLSFPRILQKELELLEELAG